MSDLDLKRRVEAVLFAADSPVDVGKLSDVLGGASRSDIRASVRELNEDYEREGHSFRITNIAGGWQVYCLAEYTKWIRELHKGRTPTRLSQAALETLAIVAYKQPIVRAEIEIIRGVDASGVLATLLKRNLVTIAGRAPGMGRALMYGTTKEFLRYFGLNEVTDLPRLEEFAEVLGLKPDELELAVEGAESLAGVTGAAADAPDVEPEAAYAADVEPEAGDAADVESEAGDDDAEETREAAPEGPQEVAEPEEATELEEAAEPEETTEPEEEPVEALPNGLAAMSASDSDGRVPGAGTVIRSVNVTERAPGSDRHAIRDRDLIDSLDEGTNEPLDED